MATAPSAFLSRVAPRHVLPGREGAERGKKNKIAMIKNKRCGTRRIFSQEEGCRPQPPAVGTRGKKTQSCPRAGHGEGLGAGGTETPPDRSPLEAD